MKYVVILEVPDGAFQDMFTDSIEYVCRVVNEYLGEAVDKGDHGYTEYLIAASASVRPLSEEMAC